MADLLPPFAATEYENAALKWFDAAVDNLSKELHPLLAGIPREASELPHESTSDDLAEGLASPLYRGIEIGTEVHAPVQDILNGDVEAFLVQLYNIADDFGSQLVGGLLQHVSDVCEATGNVVSTTDKSLFEALLETFETIDMSFDSDGNNNLTLVVSPSMAERMRQNPLTQAQEAQLEEVMARRREEWNAARHRRDLP